MGPVVNRGFTRFPGLSPDGKYFFFSCQIEDSEDIYWMDAHLIEEIKGADSE